MLLDILAHHAVWSRDKIAIVATGGRASSYAKVHAAIVGLASCLRRDFPQILTASSVAVAVADRCNQFLLTLALEYLGVTSLSFVAPTDSDIGQAIRQCPILLVDVAVAEHPGVQIMVDGPWIAQAIEYLPAAPLMPARWQARQIVNIIATSGSTGTAKCIRLSFEARNARETNRAWRYGFSPATRYLIGLPPSVPTVGVAARAVLRCAGTIVFASGRWEDDLFDGVTHTTLLPAHIRTYLGVLPENYFRPEKIRLISVGAPLPQELRLRAQSQLNAEIENNYGCNEVGGCGRIDDDGIGHVFPNTRLKIMDENGQEVAAGTSGTIWMHSDELAEGYTDELLTRTSFIDGWFASSDLGVMLGPRTFRLLGRADAMMNLGGVKTSPDIFEAALIPLAIAIDLAVTSVTQADGIEQVFVCLERPLVADAEIISRMRPVFGANVGDVHVLFVDKIPRNPGGKIQRALVRQLAVQYTPRV
jgi:acyl-coenzyme A synthetase/AMP-(fatty) acid ligase